MDICEACFCEPICPRILKWDKLLIAKMRKKFSMIIYIQINKLESQYLHIIKYFVTKAFLHYCNKVTCFHDIDQKQIEFKVF